MTKIKWTLRKSGARERLDLYVSEKEPVAGSSEYGDKPSDSTEGGKFLN
jgi:hypothetical protein